MAPHVAWVLFAGCVNSLPEPPRAAVAAQTALANADRAYVYLSLARRFAPGPQGGVADELGGGLHLDVSRGSVAIDGPRFRYLFDGEAATFHNATLPRHEEPMRLPPVAAAAFEVLLAEFAEGLRRSEWTRAAPPPVAVGLAPRPGHTWFRVNLAAALDDDYRIYLDVSDHAGCELFELVVFHADVDEIVQVLHPYAGDGVLDLRVPLCHALHLDADFSKSQHSEDTDPFASRRFLHRAMHRDEYRDPR